MKEQNEDIKLTDEEFNEVQENGNAIIVRDGKRFKALLDDEFTVVYFVEEDEDGNFNPWGNSKAGKLDEAFLNDLLKEEGKQ